MPRPRAGHHHPRTRDMLTKHDATILNQNVALQRESLTGLFGVFPHLWLREYT
jgi:hypothetical protein